ncbi:hypothetical protein A2U01_0031068, partial [Trifolium medium]|nr:hypothetical protein [Trifolium medium]
ETFQCGGPSNAPPFESWNPCNLPLHNTLSADTSFGKNPPQIRTLRE